MRRVRQGEIYHVTLPAPEGSGPGGRHYAVVIQHNTRNIPTLHTAIVCLLTGQLSSGDHPGNVTLRPSEGGLPEQSVVNTSQILTLDKRIYLGDRDYIGRVDPETMPKILEGVRLQIEGFRFDP